MNDDLDRVLVEVRADSDAFARDVADMRAALEGTLGAGAVAAGRGIEGALARAARSGKLEFEDLARAAARALGEIAATALSMGSSGGGAGAGLFAGLAGSLLGLPGRATGGPVSPGRAYVVGERGPELFVPTSSGRVEASGGRSGPVIHVNVNMGSAAGTAGSELMARTGSQIAHSLRRALFRAEF
jgi:hypothetical protein